MPHYSKDMANFIGFLVGWILISFSTRVVCTVLHNKQDDANNTNTGAIVIAAVLMLVGVIVVADALATLHALESLNKAIPLLH